jgi:hypothetical protein
MMHVEVWNILYVIPKPEENLNQADTFCEITHLGSKRRPGVNDVLFENTL